MTVNDDGDRVKADDLRWTLDGLPPAEAVDLLELDQREVLDYARELQRDTWTLRDLLRRALDAIARLTAQLDRARQTIIDLRRRSS